MSRILVVDDNTELRSLLADLLCIEGFSVSEAADGIEAIEAFSKVPPDAVLLDLQMPRRGGLEALEEIRSRNGDVPVIILTGVSDSLVQKEALRRGASGYLSKSPLDPELVVTALREAIGRDALAGR